MYDICTVLCFIRNNNKHLHLEIFYPPILQCACASAYFIIILERTFFYEIINKYLDQLTDFRLWFMNNIKPKKIEMGNFCMGDVGRNGIADRKHEKPPKGSNFRPRARRARGRKLGPAGGFSCLRSAIPFLPKSPMQKLHFIICFSEIIIPEKKF